MTKSKSQLTQYQAPLRRRQPLVARLCRILIYVVLALAFLEAGWLFIGNLTLRQVVAQWRSIEQGCWTEALFVREEHVLTAPAGGKFVSQITSGTRVPENEILGVIAPQSDAAADLEASNLYVTAPFAGYWFREVDGWEERWNPDQIPKLTGDDLARNYPLHQMRPEVSEGDICGKIVSPFAQIIAVTVDPHQTGRPKPELVWKIVIRSDSSPVTVRKIISLPDGRDIVIMEDRSMKFMQPERKLQVYLIYRRVSGISLPVQALYKKGKSYYVKIVKGVGYKAVKVEVTASDGARAILKGIEYGTTVLSR